MKRANTNVNFAASEDRDEVFDIPGLDRAKEPRGTGHLFVTGKNPVLTGKHAQMTGFSRHLTGRILVQSLWEGGGASTQRASENICL